MVDIEDYIQWAKSLVDAPVVIQQRVSTTSSKRSSNSWKAVVLKWRI